MGTVVYVHVDPIEIPGICVGLFDFVVWVVSPPEQQRGGLMIAMVGCVFRETSYVRAIIGKDPELDFDEPWLAHTLPVKMPALRCNERPEVIGNITDIGMLDAFKVEPFWKFGTVRRSGVSPVLPDQIPRCTKTFFMGIAILDDKPQHVFGVS